LTPLLGERGEGQDLPFLSSLCGACADVCPVRIPLPDMLVDLRADYTRGAGRRGPARLGWRLWSRAWQHPLLYRCSVTLSGVAGRLPTGLLARLPGPARGWARGRTLPSLRDAGALRRWFRRRGRSVDTRR
ncbi:MAG: DUF3390 domain-containing protein, partial [Pseudonocardiaceae bacterium]|nr:DUF3390 domain-containing protein [Pseudonocardiaceae bacterium]